MRSLGRIFNISFSLALAAGLAAVIWQRQAIVDWWKLRGYNAPPAIAALAQNDAMTAPAKHFFYVNHPRLMTQISDFRSSCSRSEQTIVLGCYHPGQNGIFIYDVTDTRLDGVEQVTAAHEMLHAAYERLSSDERERIDGLLNDYYINGLTDERIKNAIDLYRSSEPDELLNEMHSMFGTEIASLPPLLETYYQRYFTDRSKVVGYSAGYEDEFTNRVNQINAADKQLAQLKQKIDSSEQALSAQAAQLDSDRAQLEAYLDSDNIAAYNAAIPGFNAQVAAYNKAITQLKKDIATYNQLVQQRNAIAAELKVLQSAIDTRLTTQAAE